MRLAFHKIVTVEEFYPFRAKLSESGQKSISCLLVNNAYTIANNHYNMVGRYLQSNVEPSSYRLETEFVALVTSLLISMPKIDKIIDNDPTIEEEDKKIIKEAYSCLNSKIQVLNNMLGQPCFAKKKKQE